MYQDFSFAQKRDAYTLVVQFVQKHHRCKVSSCRQKIDADLGIFGDDNLELIEAFVEKFDLDMTGYDHDAHFLSEGEGYPIALGLWGSIFMLLVFITQKFWTNAFIALAFALYMAYLNKITRSPTEVHDMRIKDMIRWYLYKTYQPQETTNDK